MTKIKNSALLIVFLFQFYSGFSNTTCGAFKSKIHASSKTHFQSNDTLTIIKNKIDSIFVKLHYYQQDKNYDAINQSILAIGELIQPIEAKEPLFCGMMQLHQAYYAGNSKSSKPFIDKALTNFKNDETILADGYSKQLFWLIEGFYLENRQIEWEPVDVKLRNILNKDKISANEKFSIANYANGALLKKEYDLVNNLAKYDEIYFKNQPQEDVNNKIYSIYAQWLQIKQAVEQWLQVPYSTRNLTQFQFNEGQVIPDFLNKPKDFSELVNYNFKSRFTKLFDQLKELRQNTVTGNKRSDINYNEINRKNYYSLYYRFLQDYYTWALNDHKQSEAIIPIKRFLYEDIIEEEVPDAIKSNKKLLLNSDEITNLIKNLSRLYYDVGNAQLADKEALNSYTIVESLFTEKEQANSFLELIPSRIKAKRLEGDFEACIKYNEILKKYAKKPEKLNEESLTEFEWFAASRIEEIYTLMAQKKTEEATTLLSTLLDDIDTIKIEPEHFIYNTLAWTNLQNLTATINAQRGKWNTELIEEMVSDLLNKHPTSEIFYPAQLFALKSKWRENKEIHLLYLQNLILYTERQLKNNFIFLSAEERMQLYANKLNDIFDVYHELLFSGNLEAYPEIKEKVVSQSLYLKNALADGNSISNKVLLKGNDKLNNEVLNEIRDLNQRTKLQHQVAKFRKLKIEEGMQMTDKMQSMWLNLIQNSKDDLAKTTDWKTLSKNLNPKQLYFETVRYNATLSDSTAVYGAYIIQPGEKINYFTICTEKELIDVLNKENASPQNVSLKGNIARGSIGILTESKKNSNFKEGDIDLLGQLIFKKIAPFLQGKAELLMVHDGLLNRISFAALQWNKKYLLDYITIRNYSGSNAVGQNAITPPKNSKALIVGDLNYGTISNDFNSNRLFKPNVSWQYLPGTKSEIEMLQPLFNKVGYQSELVVGDNFTDSVAMKMGNYSFIHLATHGFYYDSTAANLLYDKQYSRNAMNLEPLFRSGLAISGANNPSDEVQLETFGFMMGYELANIDLRNCYLISLSACETGLGDLRNNLGVDGLSRALKIAGAKHLLISLWKVPDAATALFMKQFYTHLFSGKTPASALQLTQKEMSKTDPVADWAAFILVE